jgi:hypothetical protein
VYKQFSTKSEALLNKMTLERINNSRSDFGSVYLHTGGRFYKTAVVFSWIASIYNLLIFLAQFFGFWFKSMDSAVYKSDARNAGICCILLVIGLIMLIIKKPLPYAVASVVFSLFYFINSTFWSQITEVITSTSDIKRILLFVPSTLLMAVCALYIIITYITDRIEYKRSYSKLVDKIIATYPSSDGSMTTEEQWENYIEQYSEPAVHEKPKRSLKAKKCKAGQSNDNSSSPAE